MWVLGRLIRSVPEWHPLFRLDCGLSDPGPLCDTLRYIMKNDELVLLSNNREILHIVAGPSVGGTVRASDTPSNNVVVWFDSLTVGPTEGETLEETTRIRRKFFLKSSKCSLPDPE